MALSGRDLLERAQAQAAPLPPLLVEALRVAEATLQGAHGRRRSGPGDSFWQFRRYQPGDPATSIDWRQSARSDALYVRETEWAAAQTVMIWPDPSPSMRWSSGKALPAKRDRAALLALSLAVLLVDAGERVGLLGDALAPVGGHPLLPRLAGALVAQAESPSWPAALTPPRQSRVLLLSDFLVEAETLATTLTAWAGQGVSGYLVHVIDPAEETLPYEGRVRFSGLEGEADYLATRAEALRDAYRDRFARHCEDLRAIARPLGWGIIRHRTDESVGEALAALHRMLSGR